MSVIIVEIINENVCLCVSEKAGLRNLDFQKAIEGMNN